MRNATIGLALAAVGFGVSSSSTQALTFNFTSTGNSQVDTGFAAAGQIWSSLISDNITVNIAAGYTGLSPGVLGSAGSNTVGASYSSVRSALTSDATSANDLAGVASLPSGSSLTFRTQDRAGTLYTDNNATGNNNTLDINRANAKALGLLGANDAGTDASITFSSNFAFDFNRSNGISAGQYDFVAVAVHEIGHALGFTSGVDTVDFLSGSGPGTGQDLNGGGAGLGTLETYRVFNVLDLFRYNTRTGAGTRDLGYGGNAYFSLDGGVTSLNPFSTGDFNGDGNQASHWKDSLNIGLLDPTLSSGTLGNLSFNDLRAFDVIGYTLVPEPTSLALVGMAGLALLRRRRAATSV